MAVVPPDVAGDAGGGVAVGGGAVLPEPVGDAVGEGGDETGGGGVEETGFDDALPPELVDDAMGDAGGDAGGAGGVPGGVLVAPSSTEDTAGNAGPGAMFDKKNHSASPAAATTTMPSVSHSLTVGIIQKN